MVTLAAFLGLQGVLLKIIGEGGTIPVRDSTLLAIKRCPFRSGHTGRPGTPGRVRGQTAHTRQNGLSAGSA